MDGLNPTCTLCDKTFSTITNLNKHKRNVHKEGLDITSKKVRNKSFICPKCEYETFSTFNILLKHLKEQHDFVSNFEVKVFDSEDEFDLWRFQVEDETCCEFVQHNSTVVLADVTKKKYLHCNRSFRLSKSILQNRKRTFESQGSSITQKTCPARIEVEVQKNKNNVTVYARFWKTHLGHEPDIGHCGRVKKHCRQKISTLRLALIQMAVGEDKGENIRRAIKLVNDAISEGSSLIVLPECFNCPYGTKYFPKYAEEIPGGETSKSLSEVAKQNGLFLVGGSIPEREGDKLYNTSTVWGPEGQLLCKHRKIHLFDIDIPGGITFKESDTLAPGNNLSIFNIANLKVGLGICYDVRFSELSRLYRKKGVDIILYPAAFNMTTGPLHWELLLRARAVDEQVFVAAVSPAQDSSADYVAWGHSMVVNPWGHILKQAKFEEELIVTDLDLQEIKKVRQQIPVFKQKRQDLYDTVDVKSKM